MSALFLVKLESPNTPMILSVLVITAGTAMATYGEGQLNIMGLFLMFLNEVRTLVGVEGVGVEG
jgi:hypothetical protein